MLDESWFYFSTDHERISLAPGEPVPDRERHMIQSLQLMIMVGENPSGFHAGVALPKRTKFNTGDYIIETLYRIKDLPENQGIGRARPR
jgi:hypothetical protein